MRIVVDRLRCEANAVCMSIVPEVFDVGDDDELHLLTERPPAELRDQVEQAVMSCPKGALRIEEDV